MGPPRCQSWHHPDDPPSPAKTDSAGPLKCSQRRSRGVQGGIGGPDQRGTAALAKGEGERSIAKGVGVDRKTARRYVAAAIEAGLDRQGGEAQLNDEVIGRVVELVRPHRPDGHGESWRVLFAEEAQIKDWVKEGLTVVKIGILLSRRGVQVPHRTLARFAGEPCGARRRKTTVRVDDPPPGVEEQVDFGRLGLVSDGERRRVCTVSCSRPSSAATSSSGRPSASRRPMSSKASRRPGGSSAASSPSSSPTTWDRSS